MANNKLFFSGGLNITVVITFVLVIRFAHAQTIADVNRLSEKLLLGYNRNTLPTNNQSEHFKIEIGAALLDLGELDEINEKLTTIMMFAYNWHDDSLTWDWKEHSNIMNITMDQHDVWMPNLRIFNMHHDTNDGPIERDMEKVTYFTDGTAFFVHLKIIHTICELNVMYYPFDNQECHINMYITGYEGFSFKIDVSIWKDYLVKIFDGDGLWNILHSEIKGSDNSTVTITFKFERKPSYILINLILPIFALALLMPSVFLLPNIAAERLGFSMTTLLAISVYMTIVSSYLPQKSDPLPLLSILLFIWYIMTAFMVFIVIISVNINSRTRSTPIPAAIARFVKLYRCLRRKEPRMKQSRSDSDGSNIDYEDQSSGIFDEITWQNVSEAVDVTAFVSVYVIDLAVTLVFILVMCLHG